MSSDDRVRGTALAQLGAQAIVSFHANAIFNRMALGAVNYAVALSQSDNAIANPAFQQGQAYFDARNFDAAIEKFTIAAELGHLIAQLRLGEIFLEGIGGRQDFVAAYRWFMRAADQGESRAQFKLGWMHEAGLGVPADNRRAVYWYRVSAEAGNPEAQFNIGVKYDNGEGVEHNPEEAVRWFLMAAEQGLADARYFLGQALECGEGVESNLQEAIDWYFLASEQAHASARRRFWSLCLSGAFKPETYEEAVFAELVGAYLGNSVPYFREALRLRDEFEMGIYLDIIKARRGDKETQLELGFAYSNGDIVYADRSAAAFWYKLAAEQGSSIAWNNLGTIIADEIESTSCFKKSTEFGSPVGSYNYANRLMHGVGVEKDSDKGIGLLESSAERGYANAMRQLGEIYYVGNDTEVNYTKALEWYSKAMKHGNAGGFFGLGLLYGQGLGVAKDLDLARAHFIAAVDREPTFAQRLYEFYTKGIIFPADPNEARKWKARLDELIKNSTEPEQVCLIANDQDYRGRFARLNEKRNKARPIKSIFD